MEWDALTRSCFVVSLHCEFTGLDCESVETELMMTLVWCLWFCCCVF